MITKTKSLPKSQIALTIELEKSEWEKYRMQAIRKLAAKVSLPGFRKGHIPENILLESVGADAIMSEAIDLALPQTYLEAVRKEDIQPIAHPEVKITSEEPFSYEATVSVMPKVTVKPLKKLKLEKEAIKVGKKEIEAMFKEFQSQLAEQKDVERAAKKGDTVVIDFQGYDKDGVTLEGTDSKGHPLVLGSNQMIPGFEDEIIGMKMGEKKEFWITFPKDYHSSKFASKKVRFEVEVQAVREKILPEVDEEFVAKLTGTKKPVADLEQEIEEALGERKKKELREKQEAVLLEAVEKAVEAELPEVLISEEAEYLIDNIKMQGLQHGITWENQLVHMKKSEADLKKELRPQAEKQVRTRLGIQKFLEVDQVTVSEEDIAAEITRVSSKMTKEQVQKQEKLFRKGERGWKEAENRLMISRWVDQKLQEFSAK